MNAHTPTAMADPDESTRTLNYSHVVVGGARLGASPTRPSPARGYAVLMRCSVLRGSADRYQIRSEKKDPLSVSGGFDWWSVAELFPATLTPRAYYKDSKGPTGGGGGGDDWLLLR